MSIMQNANKSLEKRHVKSVKIFLRKEKRKSKQKLKTDTIIFLKKNLKIVNKILSEEIFLKDKKRKKLSI